MDFLSAITSVIFDHAWDPIGRHIGYLICYKCNINKLVTKFNELDALRKDVQERVDAATLKRLEMVNNEVQTWLMNVDRMEEEVKKINEKTSVISNKHYLHIGLHYKLGKEAANHIKTTDDLIRKGKFNSVSHERPPPSTMDSLLYNEGFETFNSRESRVKKILEALKNEAVHSIGLCGMGGVGKTMLVKDVAKQAKDERLFGEVVMVHVSQNIDLKRIQTEIAECLGFPLNEESVELRAANLAGRLTMTKNKVLVILDNLWETLDLSKVGIRLSQMAATCNVVITTRNKDTCEIMSCEEIVELETLSDDESWNLFKSRAGDAVESPTMRELAQNIVKECDGLPLALVVLGAALKGQKPENWKTVLNLLKQSMEVDLSEKVFQSIKLSFDFLKSETAKSCFLHCCLFPEDYDIPKEELMHLMVGGDILIGNETLNDAQGRVDLLLDLLKARGLLLQGLSEGYVRMHDVVRDVAIWISAKEHMFNIRAGQGLTEWPRTTESEMQNCRQLSLMDNDIEYLPDPMQYPKLEMLIIRGNKRLSRIPEMFFQHMGCLMVLDLSSTGIESLPESVSCLSNLRVLNLRRCQSLKDISHINGLKKLEILILGGCPVSILPEGVEWAKNVRYVNLIPPDTHLNVSDFIYQVHSLCLNDYFSKEFQGFHELEQLFMSRFIGSFRKLIISLRRLTHILIEVVVDLDDSLSHELVSHGSWPNQLLDFSITFCELQKRWPLYPLRKRCLRLIGPKPLAVCVKRLLEKTITLKLANFHETELSSIIDCLLLSSLECLEIFNWPKLTRLLGDELLLPTPENLDITNCQELIEMIEMIFPPASLQAPCFFQGLTELIIDSCPRLIHLFSYKQAISMKHLNKLYILNCAKLKVVVISTKNKEEASSSTPVADHESYNSPFPNLRDLNLYNLPELSIFRYPTTPPMKWSHLTSNKIKECPKLKELLEE